MLFCVFLNLLATFVLVRYAVCTHWYGSFWGVTNELYIEKNFNGIELSMFMVTLQISVGLLSLFIGKNIIKSFILAIVFISISIIFVCLFWKNIRKAEKTRTQKITERCEEMITKYEDDKNQLYLRYLLKTHFNSNNLNFTEAMKELDEIEVQLNKSKKNQNNF